MTKVYVNDTEVFVKSGSTALQACEAVGVEIPRFCYHDRLSIAGNCRMCLVEIEKTPKPVASCAMPLMEGMKIYTDTPLVKKAREAVLEFLLLNHPLDCPICDQGGECDLQDQALVFGSDRSRFYETKHSVEDKNYGPLVKTIMTRCIHCTRCVRFATEIAGVEDLGATGRGNETEIGTYIGDTLKSELSGNVIDLCPVGALTSKPYAFTSRPWEVDSANSLDVSDGLGCNTKIDFRGTEILRVLPRLNEDINEEWISDKARFSYDGLKAQRLTNYYESSSFDYEAILVKVLRVLLNGTNQDISKTSFYAGGSCDFNTLQEIRHLCHLLGIKDLKHTEIDIEAYSDLDHNANFLFNGHSASGQDYVGGISDIDNADVCLIINTNPKHDATLLNARLRKRFLKGNFKVALIGSYINSTYPVKHIGTSLSALSKLIEGKDSFCKDIISGTNVKVIFCNDLSQTSSGSYNETLRYCLESIKLMKSKLFSETVKGTNKAFNVQHLNTTVSSTGALVLGISEVAQTKSKLNYMINTCNMETKGNLSTTVLAPFWDAIIKKNSPVNIYQSSHLDTGINNEGNLHDSLIPLPSAAFTEEDCTFVNTEGHVQKSYKVQECPEDSKENSFRVRELRPSLGADLISTGQEAGYLRLYPWLSDSAVGSDIEIVSTIEHSKYTPLVTKTDDYYNTNAIARASQTMSECSSVFVRKVNFTE